MKNCFLVCIILLLNPWFSLQAQVILNVGNNKITKGEFLQAFLKNNNQKPSGQAFKEYLELYIRFKLKVIAAHDAGLDTLPTQKAELTDFRNQIAGEYLHDQAVYDKLVKEAFERSLKDIHLAHIFIAFNGVHSEGNVQDTAGAWKQALLAYNELQKGAAFNEVAVKYSSDKSAIDNKGDIGFITLFTLPYDLETIAYSTAAGKYSMPFKSKSGYHIFKNLGERNATGLMRIAQILFAFPPDKDSATKARIHNQADSVYNALLSGESFSQMVTLFSKDNVSYTAKGELPEFGVGTYDASFENAAFALPADGSISKPFLSAFGYHIIKRLVHIPVNTDPANDSAMAALKQRVRDDSRMEVSRRSMLLKIYRLTRFKKPLINEPDLRKFTDSAVHYKKLPVFAGISEKTLLFSFPKRNVFVADWIKYIQDEKSSEYTSSTFPALYKQYQESITTGYYLDHLEALNPEFAAQINEFKEGNLLFEIMQRNIWDKAASDSNGLKQYYESNKAKYVSEEKTLQNFDEAKGLVINDYQAYLEENWIKALKRTYPVHINNAVLQSLWKEEMLK